MGANQEREKNPRAILESTDFSTAQIEDYVRTLSQAGNIEELREIFRARDITYDVEQYLLPIFRPLYQQDPAVRERALKKLDGIGVPPEKIDLYFINSGDQPGFVFAYKHGGKNLRGDTLGRFYGAARECIFTTLKEVLCPTSQGQTL